MIYFGKLQCDVLKTYLQKNDCLYVIAYIFVVIIRFR